MKTRHATLHALLLTALSASPAWAARDPFWPVGYAPPKPVPVAAPRAKADLDEAPQPVPRPAETLATEADWALARKALVISGFTQSVKPDTGQTRTLAMVNRRMVGAGDTVTLIHNDIRFLWRAESVTDRSIQLVPIKAEGVALSPTDLK